MLLKTFQANGILSKADSNYGLVDRKVVFTGSMEKTRSEIENLAESIRMIPQKAVSKSTDLIVTGHRVGQAKLNMAMKFNTEIITFPKFISSLKKIQRYILKDLDIHNKEFEFVKEATQSFPYLINHTSTDFIKSLIADLPYLLKFVNVGFLDNVTLAEMISGNGEIYFLLPQDKKRNLNLIEAALFAKENPQIELCSRLIKAQIDVLDLSKASKNQKMYIWDCYELKLETSDVIELAKIKKDLINNSNSLSLR
jgi:hypothetical protein